MDSEQIEKNEPGIGEMHKRREKMADEKRYIIYYTFGESSNELPETIGESEGEKNV